MDYKRLEALKNNAEQSLADKELNSPKYSTLLHDISVYKAELEAQFHGLLETERRLDDSNRELSSVIELAPFGIMILDDKFRVAKLNKVAKHHLQAQTHISSSNHIITYFEDAEIHKQLTKWLLSPMSDGLRLPLNKTWLKFEKKKLESQKIIISISDITEEEKIKSLILDEEKNASRSLEKQKYFVSSVGDALQSPLNTINDILVALKHNTESIQNTTLIEQGEKAAGSLSSNIEQLLEFARLEAQMAKGEAHYLNVSDFFVSHLLQAEKKSRNNNTFTLLNELSHHTYNINQSILAGILDNLLSNADHSTQDGQIQVILQSQKAQGSFNHELLITVIDNGCGLAETELKHVFQEYYRSPHSIQNKIDGTGLGLSIAHKLVALLEGNINVKSEVNKGSTFNVSLKIDPVESLASDFDITRTDPPNFNGHMIYVVDDNPLNLEVLYRMVSQTGADIKKYTKAENLLNDFRLRQPMMIITDIEMPEMDGVKLLELLQAHDFKGPVIAATAHNQPEDLKIYQDKGFSHVLSKPLHVENLFSVLNMYHY